MHEMPSPVKVKARCVSCLAERWIRAGEVATDDMPTCHKCYGIMVAVSAKKEDDRDR